MNRKLGSTVALVLVMLVLFAAPLVAFGESGTFVGSDSAATDAVAEVDPGYTAWFSPLFAPESGEIESGLFALQAGLGGVVLGIAIGRLWGTRGGPDRTAGAGTATGAGGARQEAGTA